MLCDYENYFLNKNVYILDIILKLLCWNPVKRISIVYLGKLLKMKKLNIVSKIYVARSIKNKAEIRNYILELKKYEPERTLEHWCLLNSLINKVFSQLPTHFNVKPYILMLHIIVSMYVNFEIYDEKYLKSYINMRLDKYVCHSNIAGYISICMDLIDYNIDMFNIVNKLPETLTEKKVKDFYSRYFYL
jgi:hypothetical protein